MEEKKEIPAGLKEYVFAQYWGQKVLLTPFEGIIQLQAKTIDNVLKYDNKSWCKLQLRPLSAITDAEAIEVLQPFDGWELFNKSVTPLYYKLRKPYEDGEIDFNEDGFKYRTVSININDVKTYQYLQQQGFALPIYFQGTLFTVEQLTEMQIIKLVE